jgi:hypothetical protein
MAITKADAITRRDDRRKSPTETPESDDKGGRRLSGGRFGRGPKAIETDISEGKKKRRGK